LPCLAPEDDRHGFLCIDMLCFAHHPRHPAPQELRAKAAAEAEALKSRLSDAVARDEIVAARIKEEFWDSMQARGHRAMSWRLLRRSEGFGMCALQGITAVIRSKDETQIIWSCKRKWC
jgi:hypothetical protein